MKQVRFNWHRMGANIPSNVTIGGTNPPRRIDDEVPLRSNERAVVGFTYLDGETVLFEGTARTKRGVKPIVR